MPKNVPTLNLQPIYTGGEPASGAERTHLVMNEMQRILDAGEEPRGRERDIVRTFLDMTSCGHYDDRLPQAPEDTILCEQSLRYGRADIVIYHLDGSASVIEVKDGTYGYSHVLSGIGQTTLYAIQISTGRGAVSLVRRCLMWSSTGDVFLDSLIEIACERAGVVPLLMASLRKLMAVPLATERVLKEAKKNGCTQEG